MIVLNVRLKIKRVNEWAIARTKKFGKIGKKFWKTFSQK